MKIAVIGAGIFGCTTALKLRERFPKAKIQIYEQNFGILNGASRCNQYRLHRGYHYPRSNETVQQQLESVLEFEVEFKSSIVKYGYERYYAIANKGSKVNTQQFLKFLEENNLEFKYQPLHRLPLNYEEIESVFKVKENGLDIGNLYLTLVERLRKSSIEVVSNFKFESEMVQNFDLVVNCTYANINHLLPQEQQQTYQFELVEKPIVSLGNDYRKKSIVIADGDFCCIDPYGASSYFHVFGHVKEAIHETQIGIAFNVEPEYKSIIDRGRIKTNLSKFDRIFTGIQTFFKFDKEPVMPILNKGSAPEIKNNVYYLGSMFTIRTVLPNRDHDDARPSSIIKHTNQFYSIFGGKIGTSISIANELIKQL